MTAYPSVTYVQPYRFLHTTRRSRKPEVRKKTLLFLWTGYECGFATHSSSIVGQRYDGARPASEAPANFHHHQTFCPRIQFRVWYSGSHMQTYPNLKEKGWRRPRGGKSRRLVAFRISRGFVPRGDCLQNPWHGRTYAAMEIYFVKIHDIGVF